MKNDIGMELNDQSRDPLTSVLNLCAGTKPPVLSDAIHFPILFQTTKTTVGDGVPWPAVKIHDERLKDAFHGAKITLSPNGSFWTDDKCLKTNGAALYRYYIDREAPFVISELKNQLSDMELVELNTLYLAGTLAEMQLHAFKRAWKHIAEALRGTRFPSAPRTSEMYINRQKFQRIEFYREYPLRTDGADLNAILKEHLGKIYGTYKRESIYYGRRRSNGDELCYKIEVPECIKNITGRRSEVLLKLYRKGSRLRAEVVFLSFNIGEINQFPMTADEVHLEGVSNMIYSTAQTLLRQAESILDDLHKNFLETHQKVDPSHILTHLQEKLRIRSVKTDKRIEKFIHDLCENGSYTPNKHRDLKLEGRTLQKLKDPIYGILSPVRAFGFKNCKSYRLKDNWMNSPPYPQEKRIRSIPIKAKTIHISAVIKKTSAQVNRVLLELGKEK